MSGVSQFSCSECGRKYAWKAELAGKKVRCKCGQAVAVPTGGATGTASARTTPATPVASARPAPVKSVTGRSAPPPSKSPVVQHVEPKVESHDDAPALDDLYALAGDDEQIRQAAAAEAAGIRCPSCSTQAEPGAMICLQCGLNFQTGQPMQTTIGIEAAPPPKRKRSATVYQGPPVAGASGGAAVLAYAGRTPHAAAEAAAQREGLKQLMWPIIMVALGVIMTMVYYMVGRGTSFTTALLFMGVSTAIDLVLLFVACLIAIKMLDISLGSPGEAVLKMIAVILLPGAMEGLIASMFSGGFMVGWAVSFGMYLALLMWFFELDGSEVMILSVIIWAIRTWVGMVLVGMLLGAFMIGSSGAGGLAGGGGGGGGGGRTAKSAVSRGWFGSNLTDKGPAGFENKRAEVMLTQNGVETLEAFLERGEDYRITGFTADESSDVLEALEEAGAIKIQVADVKRINDTIVECGKVVVELPVDPKVRKDLFALYKDRIDARSHGKIQLVDHGPEQGYMILDFDGDKNY